MCFSAIASFTGGAVIGSIGAVTVTTNKEPSRRMFAAIPVIFGIQQIAEGFVWLTLQNRGPEGVLKAATFIFVIIAVVIWPTWVPLSVLLMEKPGLRRRILYGLLGLGIAVSVAHAIGLVLFDVTAQIGGYHILYLVESPPALGRVTTFAYIIATIPPLFVSSARRMVLFGATIALSLAATQIFLAQYLVSVWCFFAALASGVIWLIVKKQQPASI